MFAVDLVEVKLQWEDGETGEVHVFDGFTRNCEEIDHPLPGIVKVDYSYQNAFIIEVSIKATMYCYIHKMQITAI